MIKADPEDQSSSRQTQARVTNFHRLFCAHTAGIRYEVSKTQVLGDKVCSNVWSSKPESITEAYTS